MTRTGGRGQQPAHKSGLFRVAVLCLAAFIIQEKSQKGCAVASSVVRARFGASPRAAHEERGVQCKLMTSMQLHKKRIDEC